MLSCNKFPAKFYRIPRNFACACEKGNKTIFLHTSVSSDVGIANMMSKEAILVTFTPHLSLSINIWSQDSLKFSGLGKQQDSNQPTNEQEVQKKCLRECKIVAIN